MAKWQSPDDSIVFDEANNLGCGTPATGKTEYGSEPMNYGSRKGSQMVKLTGTGSVPLKT